MSKISGTASFSDLNLKPWLLKQCGTLGLKEPTPVQRACIPRIMEGADCLGSAQTGSGKTFAFALPILHKLTDDPYGIFALILSPTHELAYQISEQFSVLGQPIGLRVCVVAGGTDQLCESQRIASKPHVLVAMPGRLSDHIAGCNTFNLSKIQFLVLDEADRLLSGSFDEALETILKTLPSNKQTLMFSATLKDELRNHKILQIKPDAFSWSSDSEVVTVETLDQKFMFCVDYDRDAMLVQIITDFRESDKSGNVLIFTNTKKDCQLLSMTLNKIGIDNVCLHGFMKHRERVAALTQFKSNTIKILIATDVASRGLDIPSVQLVVNHRLPRDPKEYIHRVGRTARAGRSGMAISLFRYPNDIRYLSEIESAINTKLTEYKVDERSVEKIFLQVSVTKREAEINLDNNDFDERTINYRRKNWIERGLDPDVMEEEMKSKFKQRRKERQKTHKLEIEKNKQFVKEIIKDDERFKDVPTTQPKRKRKHELHKTTHEGKNRKTISKDLI